MRHIIFELSPDSRYPVAVLIKGAAFNQHALQTNYIDPLMTRGIAKNQVIAFTLDYNSDNKAPAKLIKGYLESLLPAVNSLGVKYLYCADGNYFKVLTKKAKAEPHVGYVMPCAIKGYEHMEVILGLNYQALVYDPTQKSKLNMGLTALANAIQGTHQTLGTNVIQYSEYPETLDEIRSALAKLHQYPELTCDIEGFGLAVGTTGVGSIGFAWNQHEGLSFLCDYKPFTDPNDVEETGLYGYREDNWPVRTLIREFLRDYKGKLTYHNASFDVRSLIRELWMDNWLDYRGLLEGLDTLTRNFDDTKIITYLATNSTAGNELSLKKQAHEFTGNYAQDDDDIKDIRRIPPRELLEYNLVDCLATWFVKNKRYPEMVRDNQEPLYHGLMLPSLKVIIQMELSGMPMERSRVQEAKAELERLEASYLKVIMGHPLIAPLEAKITHEAWEKDFEDRRGKAKNPDKIFPKDRTFFPKSVFNPNSGPQLQRLLYQEMGLPVIDLTDTKQPATGGDTLKKLVNHASKPEDKAFLQAMVEYIGVTKILSAFIPAFERAVNKGDGKIWLHGGFNLGGTVSGRLSSSKPNMQQLPSGSAHGKLIKSCFVAPDGWVLAGADFNALEDRINTLLTKDPNKIKVFTEGYDSHCLRAFYFFPEKLPGIVDSVESINSIKKVFPDIRQLAKSPAFALQYAGTWRTLHKNLGFPEEDAKRIEAGFRKMYKVSEDWVNEKVELACKQGYVDLAFGLRVRTPLLQQVIWGGPKMPQEAAGEARTLGNAVSGQSYGLLNNRACNEFMAKVWASPYRYDVIPIAMIHDSIYLLIRDRVDIVAWVNEELPKSMSWQELPEIQHPDVKLSAELDVHYKGWHQPITLPNHATIREILEICKREGQKYDEKM